MPKETLAELIKAKINASLALVSTKRAVLAISGGADSLALMHACAMMRRKLAVDFYVASLDHGLRGSEGRDDCQFVELMAKKWGLPCRITSVDTHAQAKTTKTNLEATARKLRYDFLATVSQDERAGVILTAHHADDQVETVFGHLLRGCGMSGLAGMRQLRKVPGHPNLLLLRPLLDLRRAQLVEYCLNVGLTPRKDTTNNELQRRRNRLRHDLLPQLRAINPQIDNAILRIAQITANVDDYLSEQADNFLAEHSHSTRDTLTLKREAFLQLPKILRSEIIRCALKEMGAEDAPYFTDIESALALTVKGEGEKRQRLTAQFQLRLAYSDLLIEPMGGGAAVFDSPSLAPGERWELPIPGRFPLPHSEWFLVIEPAERMQNTTLKIPCNSQVILRSRQPGDKWRPFGMKGQSKSLKDWFIDQKVPRRLRARLPLLEVNEVLAGVYWGNRWHLSTCYHPDQDVTGKCYRLLWKRLHH